MEGLICWMLVSNLLNLSNYTDVTEETLSRIEICTEIARSAPAGQDKFLALAVGWQESSYTDAYGKWICTRRGVLVKGASGRPRCKSVSNRKSLLTRAVGPMQVLDVYHCRNKGDCDSVYSKARVGVRLLYSLVDKFGVDKGIAIYAGGTVNPKSRRYSSMTVRNSIRMRHKVETSPVYRSISGLLSYLSSLAKRHNTLLVFPWGTRRS